MAAVQDPSAGEVVDAGVTAAKAVESGGASLATDPAAAARLAKEAPGIVKKGVKIQMTCCGFILIFSIFIGTFFIALLNPSSGTDKAGAKTPTSLTDTGDLTKVTEIPASLKPIFVAAAKKHKMSPAFLAAIFWKEHGKRFPTHGPWASSPAGANGPFQFIEKTWEGWSCPGNSNGVFETNPAKICSGYGEDGDGDGKADVQNLTDAAFSAAKLLGKNGAAPNTTSLDRLRDVASRYNSGKPWSRGKNIPETANYVPDVIAEYQKILSQM